jgi:hypothetical protein
MPCSGTRKCLHCHTFFKPDPRSKGRQNFCSQPECRQASKKASQQKWLQKPRNLHYFCGPENVLRVQLWRDKNPGYSKKSTLASATPKPLQETLSTQGTENKEEIAVLKQDALQDLLMAQPSVLIGLIAYLTGSTLQDDIVRTGQKLRELGEDFLSQPHSELGENHVISSLAQPQTLTPGSTSVQLDRSPSGP